MLEDELSRIHENEVYIMNKSDWNNFINNVKEKYPDVYQDFKENMNFNLTPVILNEEINNE